MKIKIILACCLIGISSMLIAQNTPAAKKKIIGMYVHQHWSYNHPYAARTWTLDDWRGYLNGIQKLGYNTLLIWPVLETMPDPLLPSDAENIQKIAKVIDMAHNEFNLETYIALCPNVIQRNEEASKYTFEKRPFFNTDDRVDPGDPVAFGKMIAWREKCMAPLKNTDGVFIIDSDPGGFPNSTNPEFAYLLGAYRRMLDRLRPGITIYYWAHVGWEAYSKFYATGDLIFGKPSEPLEIMQLLSRNKINEPWGVASGSFGVHFADSLGMGDRILAYPYGMIEGEPSFPLTNFKDGQPEAAAGMAGQRGVMGNSQTHCVQLPNTFAFARAAQGLSTDKKDYVDFANELIQGKGELIYESWDALKSSDAKRMNAASKRLVALNKTTLKPGKFEGLLFGDPSRFIDDLILQLNMIATMQDFMNAVNKELDNKMKIKKTLASFINAAEKWQTKHGYSNSWGWEGLHTALKKLGSGQLNETIATLTWMGQGDTQFDKIKNGMAKMETFTPRLIASMKAAIAEMDIK